MNIKETVLSVFENENKEKGLSEVVSLETDIVIGHIYDSFEIVTIMAKLEESLSITLADNISGFLTATTIQELITFLESL